MHRGEDQVFRPVQDRVRGPGKGQSNRETKGEQASSPTRPYAAKQSHGALYVEREPAGQMRLQGLRRYNRVPGWRGGKTAYERETCPSSPGLGRRNTDLPVLPGRSCRLTQPTKTPAGAIPTESSGASSGTNRKVLRLPSFSSSAAGMWGEFGREGVYSTRRRPWSMENWTRSARLLRPSLLMMLVRWVSTVRSEMKSFSATSALV